jgi:malonyl-CoA O-methyltransferase
MSEQPTPATTRHFDIAVVRSALGRLARAEQPPWLHTEIARRMAERLAIIRLQPKALVDWWGFGGAGDDVLTQAYPDAQRIVVEATDALRERSRQANRSPWWTVRRWNRVESTVVGPDEVADGSVQLVWANMMLHAARDPAALVTRWQRALAVDGFAMFSCLGPDTLRELRELYRRLDWPTPMAELVDMHDIGDMMVQAGFADPVMDQETLNLSWPTPEALLAELRTLGANASPDRFPGLRTPRWRARLLKELAAMAGPDGRISLRFEVAYGHAFKAAPRLKVEAETSFSLDDMRTMVRDRNRRG